MTTAPKIPIQINANLSVDDRKVLARSPDTKAHSTNGMDKRIGLVTVDLSADASDIDVNDVGRRVKTEIPYILQQQRSRDNPTFIANQILENLELPRQQFDFPTTAARRSRYEVKRQVADTQHGFLDDGIAASGESFDTGQQFREGERLDEVIVAAGAQAAHPVIDFAQRADDQGGRDDPVLPQAPDNRDTIDIRQHAVNRHHRIFGRTSAAQSV